MWNERSLPEPALRPEINLIFVLPRAPDENRAAPRRGQGQERFVPMVKVKVRPGEGSQQLAQKCLGVFYRFLHNGALRKIVLNDLDLVF